MKRARRTWTAEDKAEVRRLIRCTFTYAEIGERYGCSGDSIACLVKRHKLASKEETSDIKSRRLKGRKLPKGEVEALRQRMKAKWDGDPEYRARITQTSRAFRKTPEGKAATQRATRAAVVVRRGFELPADRSDDYAHLTRTKRLLAKEAAAMLGIRVSA